MSDNPTPDLAKVLASLIQTELGLADDRVMLGNQKWRIPPDDGLYIVVQYLGGGRTFGSYSKQVVDPQTTELLEVMSVNMMELYQVDAISRDNSARLRSWEIISVMTGTPAQQAQEENAFKIAKLPNSFVDTSELEASARLFRYTLAFSVIRSYTKTKPVQTFTVFQNPPKKLIVNQ
jgi:hypothetical protein